MCKLWLKCNHHAVHLAEMMEKIVYKNHDNSFYLVIATETGQKGIFFMPLMGFLAICYRFRCRHWPFNCMKWPIRSISTF